MDSHTQLELLRRLPLIILLYAKWVHLLNSSIITRHFVRALGCCEGMSSAFVVAVVVVERGGGGSRRITFFFCEVYKGLQY